MISQCSAESIGRLPLKRRSQSHASGAYQLFVCQYSNLKPTDKARTGDNKFEMSQNGSKLKRPVV